MRACVRLIQKNASLRRDTIVVTTARSAGNHYAGEDLCVWHERTGAATWQEYVPLLYVAHAVEYPAPF